MLTTLRAVAVLVIFGSFSMAQTSTDDQNSDKSKSQFNAALARAGCGPNEVRFDVKTDKTQHPVTQPEAGKALVYVFEDDQTGGQNPTLRVGLDGNWIGANTHATYLFFSVGPGEHRLCTNWQESVDSLARLGGAIDFNAEAGKTYYFRTRIIFRSDFAVDVKAIDNAEGQFLISANALSIFRQKK